MRNVTIVLALLAIACPAMPAGAHWQPGDPYKQLNPPQLPDPNGWDVDITHNWIAYDWQCGGTGYVDDIHFWYSWKDDTVGEVDKVMARIWSDVPAGYDPNLEITWSHPGELLWQGTFEIDPAAQVVSCPPSPQGWYDPETETILPAPNHYQYFQINITDIQDPFYQYEGTIYWLELHIIPVTPEIGDTPVAGWKTSDMHWNDDAVYAEGGIIPWVHLYEPPLFQQSMDMAFVITPEPATMTLLAIGAAVLLRRRIR